MQHFLYLQPLREAVIAKSGFKKINPVNCYILRDNITAKTGFNISNIAIMRLFKLSPAKFEPSLYTLNVLAMYCDYDDWENFRQSHLLGSFKKEQNN